MSQLSAPEFLQKSYLLHGSAGFDFGSILGATIVVVLYCLCCTVNSVYVRCVGASEVEELRWVTGTE